jgi:hypothetical protein
MGGYLSCEEGPFTGVSYRSAFDFDDEESKKLEEAFRLLRNFIDPPTFPALGNWCIKYLGCPDNRMDDFTKYLYCKSFYNRYFIFLCQLISSVNCSLMK